MVGNLIERVSCLAFLETIPLLGAISIFKGYLTENLFYLAYGRFVDLFLPYFLCIFHSG